MFEIMLRIGLTRGDPPVAVVRAETDFHRELHAGDVIGVGGRRSCPSAVGPPSSTTG
jgi:hypothetical protein